eukprot:15924265-Heterocapsa_arctica.AAC.1
MRQGSRTWRATRMTQVLERFSALTDLALLDAVPVIKRPPGRQAGRQSRSDPLGSSPRMCGFGAAP